MADVPILPAPIFWAKMVTVNTGETVLQLADQQPVLLIFLRFFGCSFCREAISDIARRRKKLESRGLRIVFVHMAATPEIAESFFKKYKLFPIDHIADPEKNFYRAFGLGRGTPQQLFGLMNWIRGFQATVIEGHGAAASFQNEELGDGFQMPGVFVLYKGEIRNSFIHRYAHDRPDYEEICQL
ncbi:MAG: redoxin domain-containing protein [Lewinellaceae bacterium]|nr:redoxin domain-containing protein [Lewinellaceae bacterium]